jgi:hypothetical protein
METLSYSEANNKYCIEKYFEAPFFDDAEVHVYPGSTKIDGDFDISFKGNCIFLKELCVTGNIFNSCDGEGPIFLLVLGNCSAANVIIDEPIVHINGDLNVANSVIADYNEGLLQIANNLSARLICTEHTTKVNGKISGVTVDLGGLQKIDGFQPTIAQGSTNGDEFFKKEYLVDGFPNMDAIIEVVRENGNVLKE